MPQVNIWSDISCYSVSYSVSVFQSAIKFLVLLEVNVAQTGFFRIKASSCLGEVLLLVQPSVQRLPFLKNISSFILQSFHFIDHFLANKTKNIGP